MKERVINGRMRLSVMKGILRECDKWRIRERVIKGRLRGIDKREIERN